MLPSDDFVRCTIGFTDVVSPNGAAVVLCLADPGHIPLATMAGLINADLNPLVSTACCVGTKVSSILLKRGPDETGESGVFPSALTGSSAGSSLPPNATLLITKNTAAGGRAGRGRIYWPGWRDDKVDASGLIAGADVTMLQTLFSTFLDDLADDLIPLVLEHSSPTPYAVPTEVLSLTVQSKVATQRRRLRR